MNYPIEFEVNGKKLRIYEDNTIEIFGFRTLQIWKEKKSYIDDKLYTRFFINKKVYKLHRLNYYAHNQNWDIEDHSQNNTIDHIDGNTLNNNIDNLRNITNQQNRWNTKKNKGYHWSERDKRFISRVRINDKSYTKSCKTEDEAILWRKELKEKYHKII